MKNILDLFRSNKLQNPSEALALEKLSESVQIDTKRHLADKSYITMPIDQLATLGTGVASLFPAFRTITQTTTMKADGLYRIANASVGDTLKVAKNGNAWGALKTATGKSKMVQLQSADMVPVSSTTVMPLNPATIMMAVALYSIEQRLGKIEETQKSILTFLEIEKESEIEADLETLSSLLLKYKHSWDNEQFISSNLAMVEEIKRTARKHMNTYQKKVSDDLSLKKIFVSKSHVNSVLNNYLRKFKYYRLSLYIFTMASFMEIMLSGNFKEENILCTKQEIEQLTSAYRELFEQSSVYLEKLSHFSVEANILKGIGTASNAVGKFIESIPVIREGPVDEFLQDKGSHLKENATQMERNAVEAFAEISNPGTGVFTEKMDDIIQIYGHTEEILFDDKHIYLVTG